MLGWFVESPIYLASFPLDWKLHLPTCSASWQETTRSPTARCSNIVDDLNTCMNRTSYLKRKPLLYILDIQTIASTFVSFKIFLPSFLPSFYSFFFILFVCFFFVSCFFMAFFFVFLLSFVCLCLLACLFSLSVLCYLLSFVASLFVYSLCYFYLLWLVGSFSFFFFFFTSFNLLLLLYVLFYYLFIPMKRTGSFLRVSVLGNFKGLCRRCYHTQLKKIHSTFPQVMFTVQKTAFHKKKQKTK